MRQSTAPRRASCARGARATHDEKTRAELPVITDQYDQLAKYAEDDSRKSEKT
jgi:hypothetical protein